MKILTFDISGFACSIALGTIEKGECELLAHFHKEMTLGQAHILMPEIEKLLDGQSLGVADLDGIAVTRGPGSFTGIRASLAAAKGLALAHNLPVLGVDNFSVYAHKAGNDGLPLLAALETKRRDLYLQLYSAQREALWGEGESLEVEDLVKKMFDNNIKEIRVVGDGQVHLDNKTGFSIDKNVGNIGAQDILSYIAQVSDGQFSENLDALKPLYLRPALVQ